VFSGLVRLEPLVATIKAINSDTAAYASYEAHSCLPSPNINRVGVHIALFEVYAVFTHIMACALPDPLRGAFSRSA